MWAAGHLSDEALAELLRKYQPPGMQDPCLCEDCRSEAMCIRHSTAQHQWLWSTVWYCCAVVKQLASECHLAAQQSMYGWDSYSLQREGRRDAHSFVCYSSLPGYQDESDQLFLIYNAVLTCWLLCMARAHAAREQQQNRQQEYERRRREQQARKERQQQQQQQQHKRQRDQQHSSDCIDQFDGMMGFGSQTLPPDACPAVRSVLQAADYYAVLGLSSSDYSTGDEFDQQLRSARRRAALAVHPDKVGSSGHIAASRVNLAYDALSDDVTRGRYDAYLRRCRRGG
jgi:hypothetical protein